MARVNCGLSLIRFQSEGQYPATDVIVIPALVPGDVGRRCGGGDLRLANRWRTKEIPGGTC